MPKRAVLLLVVTWAVVRGGATTVSAQSPDSDPPCVSSDSDSPCVSKVPRSMFFAGAGVGLGLLCSGEQSVYNKGLLTATEFGEVLTTGVADGPPVTPTLSTKADCVPLVQLGYFQHFGDSNWLWGVKFSYDYQGATLSEHPLVVPQSGTSSNPDIPPFKGFSVTRSYDVFVDHQLILAPFVGRSFNNGFVYAGAGPSLCRVGARLNDVVGFADLTGGQLTGLVDISGRPSRTHSRSGRSASPRRPGSRTFSPRTVSWT